MCRNITTLRGLEPAATGEEIEAAALQFIRKVAGAPKAPKESEDRWDQAIQDIATITTELLHDLPPRRNPPTTVPPMRRHAGRP